MEIIEKKKNGNPRTGSTISEFKNSQSLDNIEVGKETEGEIKRGK